MARKWVGWVHLLLLYLGDTASHKLRCSTNADNIPSSAAQFRISGERMQIEAFICRCDSHWHVLDCGVRSWDLISMILSPGKERSIVFKIFFCPANEKTFFRVGEVFSGWDWPRKRRSLSKKFIPSVNLLIRNCAASTVLVLQGKNASWTLKWVTYTYKDSTVLYELIL